MIISFLMSAKGFVQKYQAVCPTLTENECTQALWPVNDMLSNVVGIALTSGNPGSMIEIIQFGIVQDPDFDFIPMKPVYVGAGGYLTQEMPAKSVYKIGKAYGRHTLCIMPSEFLLLNP